MCISVLLTDVAFELDSSSTISGSSLLVVQTLSQIWLLLIMYLLIKATIRPASIGSNIVGITYATENYSVILTPSVLS